MPTKIMRFDTTHFANVKLTNNRLLFETIGTLTLQSENLSLHAQLTVRLQLLLNSHSLFKQNLTTIYTLYPIMIILKEIHKVVKNAEKF